MRRFGTGLPVPHVGWARVEATRRRAGATQACDALFDGEPPFFYHVHSYHPAALPADDVLATAEYGEVFPTLVGRGQRARGAVPSGEVAAGGPGAARCVRPVEPMSAGITLVDVLVLRGSRCGARVPPAAALPVGRSPGSWEMVHGHLDPGELPVEAALRELEEETGLAPVRLYNLSRVESFYLHGRDRSCWPPVFAAFVDDERDGARSARSTTIRNGCRWRGTAAVLPGRARRAAWRTRVRLLGRGDAGALEDVLRVC